MNPGPPAWQAGVLVQARRPPLRPGVGSEAVCAFNPYGGLRA